MGRNYENIKAWQLADRLALLVYRATQGFPKSEMWSLTSQMRKAAISAPANIVEGSARRSGKEYLHFLYIAIGSLSELEYYIRFATEVGYLTRDSHEELWQQSQESLRTLRGLITHVEKSRV